MVWVVVAATLVAFGISRAQKRSRDLRNLASRLGLTYIASVWPGSFRMDKTEFRKATWVGNVLEGACNGIRVVAFDFRMGKGKRSSSGTAILAEGSRDVFDATRFISEFEIEDLDDWTILHGGLMPVSELEAWLTGIGPTT